MGVITRFVIYNSMVNIPFTSQELNFMISIINEMYQSGQIRTGPIGPMVISLRAAFLATSLITLTNPQLTFLQYILTDVYQSSQGPIVTSQVGNAVRVVGQRYRKITCSTDHSTTVSGDNDIEWGIMRSCLLKLGAVQQTFPGISVTDSAQSSVNDVIIDVDESSESPPY